ncbi:hypothetical protein [Dasania marina]|uniref:hypothetical protein n=1 Tax=Dasania marina TaxID=471499 RepID=UPI0003621BFA|nr:hypothetical protein [Dasania marina]
MSPTIPPETAKPRDIFVDRRSSQQAHQQPCRRSRHSTMDSRPWWLKTTYATQQASVRVLEGASEERNDSSSNNKH